MTGLTTNDPELGDDEVPCGGRRTLQPIPDTADARFMVAASTLPRLFAEAADCLVELTVEVAPSVEAARWQMVELDADELTALASAWLDKLIALATVHHAAVIATNVYDVGSPEAGARTGRWTVRARVGLVPYGDPKVRLLHEPRSVTRLGIERQGVCWTMRASVAI